MKIALVGNQNCGKTTLFNLLTGMNQKIGNWPGVTIEKKSGMIKESDHELIDLPGLYSLNAYSEEEKISRDFILNNEADLIINVIDVTSIERSLYLTTQLMEVDVPLVVVLNMADLLDKKGIKVDVSRLEDELGVRVIKVSALKNIGIKELKESFHDVRMVKKKIFDEFIEKFISRLESDVSKRFYCVKILEKDEFYKDILSNNIENINDLERRYNSSLDVVIANQRYNYISEVKDKCFDYSEVKETVSDKLDKILLNKWLALPFFILIIGCVYYLSVGIVGSQLSDFMDVSIRFISDKTFYFFNFILVSSWLVSLLVEGVISGIGAVLSFTPQLLILFLCISILESSGYMSRVAFFLDMVFKKVGLSGKSLVPFIVGSGCSVAGIMTTRTIENKNEREMSVILTPFIPCSAKLPIIALFAGFFFPDKYGFVSVSFYFLSIFIIIIVALILKKFVYKSESNTFISELPEYKIPSIKYVLKDVIDRIYSFVVRAGSVIFLSSIVLWFMLSFSFKFEYGVDIEKSMLAIVGKGLSWVFYPILGEFSWGATVSALQGLIAKEQVVSSLSIIANIEGNNSSLFVGDMFGFFTASSAYAYVAFNLFCAPCFGAIGAIKKELGSVKKTILAIFLQCLIAWVISILIYVVGTLIIGG